VAKWQWTGRAVNSHDLVNSKNDCGTQVQKTELDDRCQRDKMVKTGDFEAYIRSRPSNNGGTGSGFMAFATAWPCELGVAIYRA